MHRERCDFFYTTIHFKLAVDIQGKCSEYIMDLSLNTFR